MPLRPLLVFALVVAAGCRSGPVPIRYGHDTCTHCRMTISDERYGAELVTATGKTFVFDSVECLAEYLFDNPSAGGGATQWVTPFDAPGTLLPADEAFFLHSPMLRSPMGLNLTAFGPGMTPEAALDGFGGEVLQWADVMRLASEPVVRVRAPSQP